MEIWQVVMHPSQFDGSEQDVIIGYYETEELAESEAEAWAKTSRPPCTGHCGCTWEPHYRRVTLNVTLKPW